jgi:hypothetical protein
MITWILLVSGFFLTSITAYLSYKDKNKEFQSGKISSTTYRGIFSIAIFGGFMTLFSNINSNCEREESSLKVKSLNDSLIASQALNTKLLLEQKDSDKKIINTQDTIISYSQKIDSNNLLYFKTYTNILAKYGLHYDSSQKNIQKLVLDSIGKKEVPFLTISRGHIDSFYTNQKDILSFLFKIENHGQSPAHNLKVKITCFTIKNGDYFFLWGRNDLFPSRPSLGYGTYVSRILDIASTPEFPKPFPIDTLFIVVSGNYTNYLKTINVRFNKHVDYLIFKDNYWGFYDYIHDKRMVDFIKEYNLFD